MLGGVRFRCCIIGGLPDPGEVIDLNHVDGDIISDDAAFDCCGGDSGELFASSSFSPKVVFFVFVVTARANKSDLGFLLRGVAFSSSSSFLFLAERAGGVLTLLLLSCS